MLVHQRQPRRGRPAEMPAAVEARAAAQRPTRVDLPLLLHKNGLPVPAPLDGVHEAGLGGHHAVLLQVAHVGVELHAGGERPPAPQRRLVAQLRAHPVAPRAVAHVLGGVLAGVIEAVVVNVLVVVQLPAQLAGAGGVGPSRRQEIAAVARGVAAVEGERVVAPRRRRRLLTAVEVGGEVPVVPNQVREAVVAALAVNPFPTLTAGKAERRAAVVEHGRRYQQVRAAAQVGGRGDLRLLLPEAPRLHGHADTFHIHRGAGDDVDVGQHAVAAVERRGRSADHLDARDQVHVEPEILAEEAVRVVDVVGERVPVEHHQEARVVVAGQRKAAHPDVVIDAVVGGVKPAHAGERFAERAVAVPTDVLRGDNGDVGGRLLERLRVQRGGLHHGQLGEHGVRLQFGGGGGERQQAEVWRQRMGHAAHTFVSGGGTENLRRRLCNRMTTANPGPSYD